MTATPHHIRPRYLASAVAVATPLLLFGAGTAPAFADSHDTPVLPPGPVHTDGPVQSIDGFSDIPQEMFPYDSSLGGFVDIESDFSPREPMSVTVLDEFGNVIPFLPDVQIPSIPGH